MADMLSVGVLAWPAVWLVGSLVYYTVDYVAAFFCGRTVVDAEEEVPRALVAPAEPVGEVEDSTSLPRFQEILDRVREETPLLNAVAEVLAFDPGPCVSVVGVITRLQPSQKGGVVGVLADMSGEIPVWLPSADGITGPKDGAVVILEGQVCCSSGNRRWLRAAAWGAPQ